MTTRKPTPDLMAPIDILDDIFGLPSKADDASWNGKEFDYPIDRIIVGKRMRPLGDVTTLVESISQIGLLNPINILPDGTLIAGNHRVAAARALGWTTIRARVVELSEVDAELAEIDENLRRNNLTVLEESEHLLRREELLEAKGLRAKRGGQSGNQNAAAEENECPTVGHSFSTTSDIAQTIGLSRSSAANRLQIAKNLDTEAKTLIRGNEEIANSTTQLLELSRQEPARQRTIADMLISGKASNVNEAVRLLSPPPAPPVPVKVEYWTPTPPTPATSALPAWAGDDAPVAAIKYLSDVEAIIMGWHRNNECDVFTAPEEYLIGHIIETCAARNFPISEDMAGAALRNACNLLVADKRDAMKRTQPAAGRIDAERRDAEETLAQDAPATNGKLLVDWTEDDWAAYAAKEDNKPSTEIVDAILTPLKPHVAHNSRDNEWYTPSEYIDAARRVMERIDLDPASCEEANSVVRAAKYYSEDEDGLTQIWRGRVWMNPPYASGLIGAFCDHYADQTRKGNISQGIVLVNNATETEWFATLVDVSSAVVFPRSRVKFWKPDGTKGAPLQGQAFLYSGPHPDLFLDHFSEFGWGAML